MIILLIFGALAFFVYPGIQKRQSNFVDIFLLYCLYFDATTVFAGGQLVNYLYFQHFLMLIFSIYYFVNYFNFHDSKYIRYFIFVVLFMLVLVLFPVFKGESLNSSVRDFSVNFTSLVILPISFHYYSTVGKLSNLLKSGYYFLIIFSLLVIFFTAFGIHESASYTIIRDRDFVHGGGILFFGNMGVRGGITYISFAALIIPLLFQNRIRVNKVFLMGVIIFIFIVLFVNLKRFSFVVIILGLLNFLFKSNLSFRNKFKWVSGLVFLLVLLFGSTIFRGITAQRYQERGGERKFSLEVIESDLRIYEPLYVLEYVFDGNFTEMLIGPETSRVMDVYSDIHNVAQRQIHNQYGQYLLVYGIIGLSLYLLILSIMYYSTRKIYLRLKKLKIGDNQLWIFFQNMILIFALSGMVGGHVHVTFRGMVFYFSAGIAGYFYKVLKQNQSNHLLDSK
jgi:hypothetical protein